MHDNEESKIKRFVSGLRREIKYFVKLHEYYSLKKVVHLAIKVESHLLKTTLKNTHDDGFYNSSRKDAYKIYTQHSPSKFSKETISSQKISTQNPSTPKSTTKTSKTKCFKCLKFGHIVSNFPLKRSTLLHEVKQYHLKTKTKSENENEKEGHDTMGLIPSPPRCFPSLSFSFPKHSKYLTFLFKKFRDAIPNPPKGSHLLRGFSQNISSQNLLSKHVLSLEFNHIISLNLMKISLFYPYILHLMCANLLYYLQAY